MKIPISLLSLILFISCKENNSSLKKQIDFKDLRFSTEKIIIEELSEKQIFHFLIKIESLNNETFRLPIIELKNQNAKNETLFYLKAKNKSYSTISHLLNKSNDTIFVKSEKPSYLLLSLSENFKREDLDSAFIEYKFQTKKLFPIINLGTEKIITDHKIDIEEAIKLSHGKINETQY